jgi:gliding motility-associated-like protein
VTCFGLSTGQAVILNAPGGLTYNWSSGSVGPFAINYAAGQGWVYATEGSCKSDTVFFTVGTFPPLSIDNSKTQIINPSCYGDNNGAVTIVAQGGTGLAYSYTWANGVTGASLTNITAGAYIVTINDSNNCMQSDTFLLLQPEKLEASIDRIKTVELDCNNRDGGKIGFLTTGGNPGKKTFSWQSGVIVDGDVAIGLSPGTYCATVSDNFGCKDTTCYTLVAPAALQGELNTPAEPLCNGGTTCISVKTLTGGTGNKYTFQINNGTRYPLDTCVTVFAGQYFINLIDSAGCSIDTVITIGQPEPISVDLGPDREIQLGLPSPVINASVDSPVGIDTVVWTPFTSINCLTVDCVSVEINPAETTTYLLTVSDQNGCTGTDDITITVKDTRNVYFANIFTPNRDGNNDYFHAVTGPGVEKIISFAIFDRWGNRVFEKADFLPDPAGTDGWDGTFDGRRLDPGVFVYYAKALFIDGKEIEYSGSVTLADKVRN